MAKIPVEITYERQVVNTAEGQTLSSILADIGRLTSPEDFGKNYRTIYGTRSERDVEHLRRRAAEFAHVKEAAVIVSSSLKTSDAVGGEIISAGRVAALVNANIPRIERPGGDDWGPKDFTEPFYPGAEAAFKRRFNAPLITITEEEIDAVDRVAKLAASLGLRLEDVGGLPSFGTSTGMDVSTVKVVAHYIANPRVSEQGAVAGVDYLRFNAPRPGGRNYSPLLGVDPRESAIMDEAWREASEEGSPGGVLESARDHILDLHGKRIGQLSPFLRHKLANTLRGDNYAVLRVITGFQPGIGDPFATGEAFRVLFQTNKFILERIDEQQMERTSFVETFGDTYLYLFGTKAKVWSYSGVLADTMGMDWLNSWRKAYDQYIKGSASTKLRARAFLIYDNVVREGVIVATSVGKGVGEFGFARFSFSMFVLKEYFLDGNPNPDIPDDIPTVYSVEEEEKNRDERYQVIGPNEVTPSFAVDPSNDNERRAREIENGIFAREKFAIEEAILKDAFVDGKLVRTSGTVAIDLSAWIVREAARSVLDAMKDAREFPVPASRRSTLSEKLSTGAFAVR